MRRKEIFSGRHDLPSDARAYSFHNRHFCYSMICKKVGLSAGTGKLCIFGHLGLVFIWSCFVSCLLLLLYYVICAPVLTEGTKKVAGYSEV